MGSGSEQNGRGSSERVEIAIVGAGFCGLGMAIRLQQAGYRDLAILERCDELGGTWRENTYPGCRCDVPSHLYSFSFALNPEWSHTYSPQEEIWDYLRDTADRFGVSERIRFGCEVLESAWDEEAGEWRLATSRGELRARYLISAPGALAEPSYPDIPGLDRFGGPAFHSAEWDHDAELAGKRVAVIGTGASAIQIVPAIQPEVERMHVFQRTPTWVMPHRGRRISELERRLYRRFPALQRLVRSVAYAVRELPVPGFAFNHRWNGWIQRIAVKNLERHVADPELRRRLTPDYTIGCKRIVPSNDFYPALQAGNVELVTDAIAEVREGSIVTADGAEREVDAIVLATGFKVLEMPAAQRLRGRGGAVLGQVWEAAGGPEAHLGTTVAGFPNMFLLLGPNTGLGTNSVVFMAEAQMSHILSCLDAIRERGASVCEVRADAQRLHNRRIERGSRNSVWTHGGCVSWYLDDQGRNRAIWPSYSWRFWQRVRRMRPADYALSSRPAFPAGEAGRNGAAAAEPAAQAGAR
jgi:cation diffusion facilitator CzcD-associated flavoprotein CzcO